MNHNKSDSARCVRRHLKKRCICLSLTHRVIKVVSALVCNWTKHSYALWIPIWRPTWAKSTVEKMITMRLLEECNLNMELYDDQSMNISKWIRSLCTEWHVITSHFTFYSHIFWIGDLNYRLADNPPRELFDTNSYADLLKCDQLFQEMQRKRVFVNYTEGPIDFRPTYKYDPGTDNWDSRYLTSL